MDNLVKQLDGIFDTYYTDNPIPNRFLISVYGTLVSGRYVKESLDYYNIHPHPHFELDLDVFDSCVKVSSCDMIWLIKDRADFERLL